MTAKFYLFISLFFISGTAFAQIAKSNLIIEGGASLQFIQNKIENVGSFGERSEEEVFITISPTITYFTSDRFAIGGGIIVTSIANTGTNFGLSGNARFYLSSDEVSGWFLKTQLGFLTGSNSDQFYGDVGLGWDVFLSPNLALESTMSIGFSDTDDIVGNLVQFQVGTGLKFFFDRFPEVLSDNRNEVIQKGNAFYGLSSGSVLLSRRNNTTQTFVNLMPSFGKFATDNLLLGALINLTNQSGNGFTFFTIETTPFIRYYLNPAGKKLVPFGEIGGGLNFRYIGGDFVPNQNQTETSPIIFGNIGVNYFIRPTIAFEVKVGYRNTKLSDMAKQNRIGLTLGFQFFMDRS